jgi:hypothetical protein
VSSPSAHSQRAHSQGAREEGDAPEQLDELSVRVLDFERAWASRVGAKDAAIRSEFSIPAARYYQMLYALIDSPVALRSDPLLVRRLQRLRDARSRARAARTFRTDSSD